ncbi:NmrA-like family domain-containing protein 1 [Colletotrichum spinosum]|uniref:NmrA-like family domain-containing protein 1 n=1 Tax=Colletotrichum spinosum TaxID=1347390 RepID=A0A4R8QPZ0_9PEZI|nr:NmrA-like family domain-containing protein 1 [Colletotrichum spinosum]
MPPKKTPRTIVVIGATGKQGGGVVRALLASDQDWHVRALTRDVSSSRAQYLLSDCSRYIEDDVGRLTLVQGHVYDLSSLQAAFSGAYGVFAITSEVYPGKTLIDEAEMAHEIEAGRNMVSAAEEAGIEHFVFSSLPDMVKTTSGKFTGIHHMDNKYAVEQIAKEHLSGVTCLIPGFFYTNLGWPQYSQRQPDGEVRFCTAIPSDQVAQWTDPSYDMGSFAARVFDLGVDKTAGKTYPVMSPLITPDQMAATFTRLTGQPASHSPITPERFGEMTAPFVGPALKADAQQMMEWASMTPSDKICFGAMEPHEDRSFEDLGLKASTFEDWLRRSGWRGPE